MKIVGFAVATALCLFASAGSASAQALRTWVSGVGDDANPCGRTAPCKTFAGAISKTAAAGEISVLDPGGFGAVTITKSISIVADGSEGSILASSTNGIIINGANIVVYLKGLTIEGAVSGLNGVRFIQGSALHLEGCVIRGFNSGGAGNANGILFAPSTAAELEVVDTLVANNGSGTNGSGILIKPSAGGSAKVSLTRVSTLNNINGVLVDSSATTGALFLTAKQLTVSGNAGSGVLGATVAGAGNVRIVVDESTLSNNGTGVRAIGAPTVVMVGRSSISGNTTGVSAASGGSVPSYGTNQLDGNTNDGAFTGSVLQN